MTDVPVEAPAKAPRTAPASGGGGLTVNTSGSSVSTIVGAGCGLALAAYIGAVAINGNIQTLGSDLMQEEGYLEFVIAIVVLWALAKYGPTGPITDFLIAASVIAFALRVSSKVQLPTILSQFASGQASMAATVKAIAQGL